MRALAYVAAILSVLVWAFGALAGYDYALIQFGLRYPCCSSDYIHPELANWIAGVLVLFFPLTALAALIWFVFSGFTARRPAVVLALGASLLVVGLGFTFITAIAVTPL